MSTRARKSDAGTGLVPAVALLLTPILLVSGCAESTAFQNARAQNTAASWRGYLNLYPAGSHVQAARKALGEIAREASDARWKSASATDTAAAYVAFAKRDPNSPHAADAKSRAQKILAAGKGMADDYAAYLDSIKEGDSAVRRGLEKLRYREARSAATPAAYEFFVAEYPGSRKAASLKAILAGHEYKEAKSLGTRLGWDFFLRRFPDAAQTGEAKAALAALPAARQVAVAPNALGLLSKLREASPLLRNRECFEYLSSRIASGGDLYGAAAESLRASLIDLEGGGDPASVCADRDVSAPASRRAAVAAAMSALVDVAKRQQSLTDLASAPDATLDRAREIGKTAAGLHDQAESTSLEVQALYGVGPADPDHPKERASRSAAEALARAKAAYDDVRGALKGAGKASLRRVFKMMRDEQDLLVRIVAFNERPSSGGKLAEDGP